MSAVCLIDTSVFLNLLNVPNRNQTRAEVVASFEEYAENNCTFILPMATILETGNHIARTVTVLFGAKLRCVSAKPWLRPLPKSRLIG